MTVADKAKAPRKRGAVSDAKATKVSDGFKNLTARIGMGAKNIVSDGSYEFNYLTRNHIQLEAAYRTNWVVGSVIDVIAEDMTRAGINFTGDIDPSDIEIMQQMLTRMGLWRSLLEAIKWGRLYGGAIACMVIDGQEPSSPLDMSTVGKDAFKGLRVYDRWSLQPDLNSLVQEGMSAGLPEYYTLVGANNDKTLTGLRWHHTRAIRFIGIQLPHWQAIIEQLWGESVLERMYDRLIAFDTVTASAAELIQKAHLRVVQIEGLRDILSSGGQREENLLKMFDYMQMIQNNQGLTLLDAKDTFSTTSYSFAGLSDMMLQFGQQIAGAAGIPLVRLFGQSPAGLSATGESDIRMYYDNVLSQQEGGLRDGLTRVLHVLHQSAFQKPAPEGFDFEFVPLWQTSQKEKADISTAITSLVNTAFQAGVIDQATGLRELKQSSEHTGIFTNITDAMIKDAELEPAPMPVEQAAVKAPEEAGEGEQDESQPKAKTSMMDRLRAWANGEV